MRVFSKKKGEIMKNVYRACREYQIVENYCSGLNVTLTSSTYCSRVCERVTFTVTITNNCPITALDVRLHLPRCGVYCVDPSTITLNGEAVDVTCLDDISVGDLGQNAIATVTYTATIMEYKRCLKTRVLATYYNCPSMCRKNLAVYSNCNLVHVCPCCASTTVAGN